MKHGPFEVNVWVLNYDSTMPTLWAGPYQGTSKRLLGKATVERITYWPDGDVRSVVYDGHLYEPTDAKDLLADGCPFEFAEGWTEQDKSYLTRPDAWRRARIPKDQWLHRAG